jgi:hypothetical protein
VLKDPQTDFTFFTFGQVTLRRGRVQVRNGEIIWFMMAHMLTRTVQIQLSLKKDHENTEEEE